MYLIVHRVVTFCHSFLNSLYLHQEHNIYNNAMQNKIFIREIKLESVIREEGKPPILNLTVTAVWL
jgi:hypothetical protein